MTRVIKSLFGLILVAGMLFVVSCGDDDEGTDPLAVATITASGTDFETGDPVTDIDLFGATAADAVPLDPDIIITFNKDVDESTVTASNITVTGGDPAPTPSYSTSGEVVTITFDEELQRGTDYTITVTTNVKAADGSSLNNQVTTTFGSAGRGEVTPPQEDAQQIYLPLDGSAEDATGNYAVANEAAVEYGEDRFGQPGSAAYFDGDATIIEYENGVDLLSQDFTMSFWMHVDTVDHLNADGNLASMFVVGMGNFNGLQVELDAGSKYNRMKIAQTLTGTDPDRPTAAEDFTIWGLDGTLEDFEVNRGADFENTVDGGLQGMIVGKWAHVVYVYNSAENARYMYINGVLQRSDMFENSTLPHIQAFNSLAFNPNENQDEPSDPEYISTRLALGFIHGSDSEMWATEPWGGYTNATANHFKGALDDFRIFNSALSASEVTDLYDDEAP